MKAVIVLVGGGVLFVVAALMSFMMVVVGMTAGPGAAINSGTVNPSVEAIDDIGALLPVYINVAGSCPGLPWQVVAGIGKVESDHGRWGGRHIDETGDVTPPIIGIRLDGTNGTAVITDTDHGVLDGDVVYDRAVGPMQFIPSSWAIFARDGNHDGIANPHNYADATHAAVAHLCPAGELTDVRAALFGYNRSWDYVALVLDWAARYTGTAHGFVVDTMALPVPVDIVRDNPDLLLRPHHNYPAVDIAVPVATSVFAMTDGVISIAHDDAGRCGGTIVLTGSDGHDYSYCHLSAVLVTATDRVAAGQQIALSGGAVGAPGSGRSTGPHLHLSIRAGGISMCPQPVLWSIHLTTPINPAQSPTTGCITDAVETDWPSWLAEGTKSHTQDDGAPALTSAV